jgi:hypothetical protein
MSELAIVWLVIGLLAVILLAIFAMRFYPELARTLKIHRM